MSFLSLLSTIAYNSNGTPVPTGYIQTVPEAGKSAIWTSTLGTATALSVSTLVGSTLSTRNMTSQSISGLSTLTGSTMTTGSLSLSTLTGSTMTTGSLSLSTLTGSTVTMNNTITNTLGVSTLSVSTLLTSNPIAGSVNTSTLMASTLTAVNITTSTFSVTSTMLSIGPNSQSTMVSASQGSYAAGSWQTAKSGLTNARKLAMSSTGQYQLLVSDATSSLWLSSDSGVNWTALGASQGLPVLTGSAYWSAGAISASGQQITLAVYGGSLWFSSDFGRTFATSSQATPDIWLQLNGDVTDTMGGAAATATGSPSYITFQQPGFSEQAIYLANTAGGTATQYVRRNWAGANNVTISFWFNAQTVNGSQQIILDTPMDIAVYIAPNNQLYYQFPYGGGSGVTTAANTTFTISANTWYYVTIIFQLNGLCSMYVNNTLIGSSINVGGYGTLPTSGFISLGTYDNSTLLAFNGYIADFRLTNSALPYVPVSHLAPAYWLSMEGSVADAGSFSLPVSATPTIYLPLEGSVTDSQGFSTVTATGAPVYVTTVRVGSTGTQAINLANTAGSTATKYVRGTWTGSANSTISFWFNPQTINGQYQSIFSSYAGSLAVAIDNSNRLYAVVPNGGGTSRTVIASSAALTVNTWYYVTVIFQTGGLCSFYLNNVLIGTLTNSSGVGTLTTSVFELSGVDNDQTVAFNGYVDDVRIYNSAIPYVPVSVVTPVGAMNYVPGVVGQTALYLANETNVSASTTASNYLALSYTQSTPLTFSLWFRLTAIKAANAVGILTFTDPASSISSLELVISPTTDISGTLYVQFNQIGGTSGTTVYLNTWYHIIVVYQPSTSLSLYVNGQFIGSRTSGIPASLSSSPPGVANGRIVLGDRLAYGSKWAFAGYIDDFRIYNAALPYSSLFPQNYSHLAMSGDGVYQMVATQTGSQSGQLWLSSNMGTSWTLQNSASMSGTWSALSASYSGKYLTAQSQPVVQPNQSGLAAYSWSQQGITYTALASTEIAGGVGFMAYKAFNNTSNNSCWAASGAYSATTGLYGGSVSTTIQGGIGAILGEWLQLQLSSPMVIQSYRFGNNIPSQLPKIYYIIGSNDGSTWYPIQYVTMTTNPMTTGFTDSTTNIIVNYTGTQTVQGQVVGSGSTTSYATSTQSYVYFRIVVTSTWNDATCAIGEWYCNFIGGSITPNLSGLASAGWSQSGVGWFASASSVVTPQNLYAYGAFNNYSTNSGTYSWASAVTYATTTGSYYGTTQTAIQGIGSVYGEWLQLQGSIPLVLQSYTYGCGGFTQVPKTYYIVGSNDGSNWYPLQYVVMTTNPNTANFTTCSTHIIMNYSGTQTIQGSQTGSGSTTAYAPYVTQAWMYFRVVFQSIWESNFGSAEFGEFYPFFSAGQNSSSNYGLTWSPTLQTGDAFNVTKNVTVLSSGTGWAQLPAFRPVSTGVTISMWFMLQTAPTGSNPRLFMADTSSIGSTTVLTMYFSSSTNLVCLQNVAGVNTGAFNAGFTVSVGVLYHIAWTINGSGGHTFYVNGSQTATGSGTINVVTYPHVYIGKTLVAGEAYPNMTVADFRMFNRGLNAAEVSQLYANQNYGQPAVSPLTLSESGEYTLAANQSIVAVGSNYLTGHQASSYSNPLLSGINAPVVDTAVSQTGQYMVVVTAGTTNNVYYSRDYGATFTGLTLGSSSMVSCSISHDGSYLTVSNRTTTYRLNSNSTGYSVAVGSQAGQINQAQNAIAIGNRAGQTNQTANSIVLNASGSAVNSGSAGFYVAPISGPSGLNMDLLGYGSDKQVTTTGITVMPGGTTTSVGIGGSVGVGITNPNARLQVYGVPGSNGLLSVTSQSSLSTGQGSFDILQRLYEYSGNSSYLDHMWVRTTGGADWTTCALRLQAKTDVTWHGYLQFNGSGNAYGISFGCGGSSISPINVTEAMRITSAGSVGIGTTTPSQRLDVNGSINCTGLLVNGTAVATGTGSVWGVSGSNISYTSGLVSIGTVVNPTPNSVGTTNLATYGNVCVYRNRVIFSNALTDWNHTIYNNFYNNDGEGSWDGMKMNVYAGLSIRVGNAGGVIPTTAMYINNSGQVGIGTTNPIFRTHIHGGNLGVSGSYSNSQPNKTIRMGYNDNSSGGDYAWIYSYDSTAGTYKNICINEAGIGNVGIGTTNPLAKLHIATADPGTTTAISFQNINGYGIYASSTAISARGNTLDWYSYDYNNTAITTRHVLTMRPEGNVGIGTASPSINSRLHIHGATASNGLIISNTTNVNAQCIFGVDGNGNLFLTPLLQGSFFSSVVPGADNSCALGGSSYRWTAVYAVNGTIQTSDSSVKDSVPLSYGINEVLQMRTIKYKWKSQANLPDDDPKKNFEYYGFCADELGALFPELVYDEDKTAPVQLNYTELLPVVVNAMKDVHASLMVQKTVMDNQASRITSLESALADKSAQLDALLTWARAQGFAG